MLTSCSSCGYEFEISDSCCGAVTDGDISVQYFSCPSCGWKHQILTTDPEMRALIEKRKSMQRKTVAGRSHKFREKTLRGYVEEDAKIKARQEQLLPALKKRGEEILHGAPPGASHESMV
jgi:hypothetical protein